MPTQEEKGRVNVFGLIFDLRKVGADRRGAKEVQILAESAVLWHLERGESFAKLEAQVKQLQKQTHCEHARPDWDLRIGPPRGGRLSSSVTVRRTVTCTCQRCGKQLFEVTGTEGEGL